MNRIRNALGSPGSLNLNEIRWTKKGKYLVPSLVDTEDRRANIWSAYFDLLFFQFHLLERFIEREKKEALRVNAPAFYEMFYAGEEVNKDRLLELLTGDPRDWAAIIEHDESIPGVKDALEAIGNVFKYDYLVEKNGPAFSYLIVLLDVNVCPYCGRTFTNTIKKNNDGSLIRTCQADHYYPKSRYPWLALSIWNLIPTCPACNHRKSDNEGLILYPYGEEMGDAYSFRTRPIGSLSYLVGARETTGDFVVELMKNTLANEFEAERKGYCERAEREIESLSLNELYSVHKSYVLNIFHQRYIFSEPYIEELCTKFGDLFHEPAEVREMLYMKRIDPESIGSDPLDKLCRDIDREIDWLERIGSH